MPDAPVVLLHGFAGAPAAWDTTIAAWPRPAPRFVVPALPGHGPIPAHREGTFIDAVDALSKVLPEEQYRLVGYSLGGRMSLGLAARAPERCLSLSLVGAHPGLDDAARAGRQQQDERWAQRLETEGIDGFMAAWKRLPLFETQASLPASALEAQDAWRRRLEADQLAAAMRQLSLAGMPNFWPFLVRASMPVQIVVGSDDAKFRTIAEDVHRRMTNTERRVRLDLVPDSGHNVVLERPEALAMRLHDFHRTA